MTRHPAATRGLVNDEVRVLKPHDSEDEMTTGRLHRWLAAGVLCVGLGALASAQQEGGGPITIAFSDPSRPGRLRIELLHGTITIKGVDRRDVAIEVRQRGGKPLARSPEPPGLRRLTQNASFTVNEDANEVRVESASFSRALELDIQVPLRTSLKLSAVNGDGIAVEGVEGDIEIESVNGLVSLVDVAGSVVANSVNAPVRATLTRMTAQKAMAFTSFNGAVDVTLPHAVKASFKLRSDQGDVFTDFDIDLRPATAPAAEETRPRGRYRLEVNRAIYGTVGGGGPEIELRSFNGNVYLRRGQ